jgi:hypothetical protein
MNVSPYRLRLAVIALAALTTVGCGNDQTAASVSGLAKRASATSSAASFTVGPLVIRGIDQEFPGDNWHLRDVRLTGAVTGDVSGAASMILNANLDGILGSGPAWGTLTIVTASGDVWDGAVTGEFLSGLPARGIQLLSRVTLHGPDNALLQAECDETTATSETLVCTGDILSPAE